MGDYEILDISKAKEYVANNMPNFSDNVDNLKAEEVGDGNLNLVFKLTSKNNETIILKQALPYVRLVGKDWPMTRDRSRIESEAIKIQSKYCPNYVPDILYIDHDMSLFIMEDLSDYNLYAYNLMNGEKNEYISDIMGEFFAKTLFYTSDLYMNPKDKKEEVKRFTNPDLCKITEDLIFSEPYFDAKRNNISEGLRSFLENDFWKRDELKKEVAKLKYHFMTHAEALIHGDLHTRSIFVKGSNAKVFDQEFAFFGPMGFDFGLFFGNLLLNFVAQEYWSKENALRMQNHISEVIEKTWWKFEKVFLNLMENKIDDEIYSIEEMKDVFLRHLLSEAGGYSGTSAIRRIHGLAGVPDFWEIEDQSKKIELEKKALNLGTDLIINRESFESIDDLLSLIDDYKVK